MKQLLLRIPDELHHKLTVHAARSGRSVNSVATDILDSAIDAENGGRQERLRARAAALGILRQAPAEVVGDEERVRALAMTHGLGQVIDRLLDEERERV
jgi:plasmid stability protein